MASVLSCMHDELFRSVNDIAKLRGRTPRGTLMVLERLLELRRVEKATEKTPGWGGRRSLWRRVPEGYEAPLYEPTPGLDARALDKAMGGHTFARKTKPAI